VGTTVSGSRVSVRAKGTCAQGLPNKVGPRMAEAGRGARTQASRRGERQDERDLADAKEDEVGGRYGELFSDEDKDLGLLLAVGLGLDPGVGHERLGCIDHGCIQHTCHLSALPRSDLFLPGAHDSNNSHTNNAYM
jgi:hypothetical protein